MSFIWPGLLLLLLLVPLLIVLYVRLYRRRTQAAARFGTFGLTTNARNRPSSRRHAPPAFFLLSLLILIVALARPQADVSLPRIEGTIILAFDVSGSMAADDLKPTRIDAARAAAQDFVQRQPITVKIGIVAFSDAGLAVQVPTTDQAVVLAAIKRLKPESGSSLGNGILAALNVLTAGDGSNDRLYSSITATPVPSPTPMPKGSYQPAAIVLLSDGDNNEPPDPLVAAQTAADRGVRIYTIGIGSPAGADVHIKGFTLHTQLNEPEMQQIAQISGGRYYNASTAEDLQQVYDTLDPQWIVKPEQTEITALFAGVGIAVLLIGGAFSMLWFSRLP